MSSSTLEDILDDIAAERPRGVPGMNTDIAAILDAVHSPGSSRKRSRSRGGSARSSSHRGSCSGAARSSARASDSGVRASSPSLHSGAVELLQPFDGFEVPQFPVLASSPPLPEWLAEARERLEAPTSVGHVPVADTLALIEAAPAVGPLELLQAAPPPAPALPPTVWSEALKARAPRVPTAGVNDPVLIDALRLASRTRHVAESLPPDLLRRIVDGRCPGSSVQIAADQWPSRVTAILAAGPGGKDGSNLRPKLVTLARFSEFAAAHTPPVDIFACTVGPALVGEYVESERIRALREGKPSLPTSALSDLRFAALHFGFDAPDLRSDAATTVLPGTSGGDQVTEGGTAGTIPLALQRGREACANECGGIGPSDMTHIAWLHVCARIIMFIFGLRGSEIRTAQLQSSGDERLIRIRFRPKGSGSAPWVVATRFAFGVLGPFDWWPHYRERMRDAASLLPDFDGPDVFRASRQRPGCLSSPNPVFLQIASHPVYGIPMEAVQRLGLRSHSDHGSLSDVVGTFGAACGYHVEHCQLVAGHWKGIAPSGGADGSRRDAAARRAAATRARADAQSVAMPARYGSGSGHTMSRTEGPAAIWSILSLPYAFLRASSAPEGPALVPGEDWLAARRWALDSAFVPTVDPPFPSPPFSTLVPVAQQASGDQ
eukprot:7390176-Prymnesium_polylepis.1